MIYTCFLCQKKIISFYAQGMRYYNHFSYTPYNHYYSLKTDDENNIQDYFFNSYFIRFYYENNQYICDFNIESKEKPNWIIIDYFSNFDHDIFSKCLNKLNKLKFFI